MNFNKQVRAAESCALSNRSVLVLSLGAPCSIQAALGGGDASTFLRAATLTFDYRVLF